MSGAHDFEVARQLGALTTAVQSMDTRLGKVETKLDSVVATTNRWKGATGLMVIIGGLLGWVANLWLKANGKA